MSLCDLIVAPSNASDTDTSDTSSLVSLNTAAASSFGEALGEKKASAVFATFVDDDGSKGDSVVTGADSASVISAMKMGEDVLNKADKVDGVVDANKSAKDVPMSRWRLRCTVPSSCTVIPSGDGASVLVLRATLALLSDDS